MSRVPLEIEEPGPGFYSLSGMVSADSSRLSETERLKMQGGRAAAVGRAQKSPLVRVAE